MPVVTESYIPYIVMINHYNRDVVTNIIRHKRSGRIFRSRQISMSYDKRFGNIEAIFCALESRFCLEYNIKPIKQVIVTWLVSDFKREYHFRSGLIFID